MSILPDYGALLVGQARAREPLLQLDRRELAEVFGYYRSSVAPEGRRAAELGRRRGEARGEARGAREQRCEPHDVWDGGVALAFRMRSVCNTRRPRELALHTTHVRTFAGVR